MRRFPLRSIWRYAGAQSNSDVTWHLVLVRAGQAMLTPEHGSGSALPSALAGLGSRTGKPTAPAALRTNCIPRTDQSGEYVGTLLRTGVLSSAAALALAGCPSRRAPVTVEAYGRKPAWR